MTIAIHQPNFVPWIGYFFKISRSDKFILLDNVQFTKNGFINRNRIKTPNGENWLTLPVIQSGKFGQNINDVLIFNKAQSVKKVLATLNGNYKKARYFEKYIGDLTEILNRNDDHLCELNIDLIKWICKELNIKTELIVSSKLDAIEGESTERLVSLCKKLNAEAYLAGFGSKKYQEDHLFEAEKIKVINTPFKHPTYPQVWGEFLGSMSVLDLLFNCGPEAETILKNAV